MWKSWKSTIRNDHAQQTVWKFTLTIFWQKFRERNGFTKVPNC